MKQKKNMLNIADCRNKYPMHTIVLKLHGANVEAAASTKLNKRLIALRQNMRLFVTDHKCKQ